MLANPRMLNKMPSPSTHHVGLAVLFFVLLTISFAILVLQRPRVSRFAASLNGVEIFIACVPIVTVLLVWLAVFSRPSIYVLDSEVQFRVGIFEQTVSRYDLASSHWSIGRREELSSKLSRRTNGYALLGARVGWFATSLGHPAFVWVTNQPEVLTFYLPNGSLLAIGIESRSAGENLLRQLSKNGEAAK